MEKNMVKEPTFHLKVKKYPGEFKNGKYDGQGTENYSSGWDRIGDWKEGKPWNIIVSGKSGITILEYVNKVKKKCNNYSSSSSPSSFFLLL